jgi:phage shock protein E
MVRSAVAAGVVGVVAYFALGMPGMDHGSAGTEHDMSSMSSGADGGGELVELDPSAFADAMNEPLGVVINVHVPYAGEIPGTDALAAYDEIENSSALPSGASNPILLYCLTGDMSRQAARTLADMGYTNVRWLTGGMTAWQAAGRPITTR